MSFLLDTHAFLWFVNDPGSLSPKAKGIIEDQQNLVYLSAAKIWEMAKKPACGSSPYPLLFSNSSKLI